MTDFDEKYEKAEVVSWAENADTHSMTTQNTTPTYQSIVRSALGPGLQVSSKIDSVVAAVTANQQPTRR